MIQRVLRHHKLLPKSSLFDSGNIVPVIERVPGEPPKLLRSIGLLRQQGCQDRVFHTECRFEYRRPASPFLGARSGRAVRVLWHRKRAAALLVFGHLSVMMILSGNKCD